MCPNNCGEYEPGDNYCRHCGMYVAAPQFVEEEHSLIVTDESPRLRALAPQRAGLPAPVNKVAAAVAVGTALQVGVALFARYLSSTAPKPSVRPQRVSRRALMKPQPPEAPAPAPVMDNDVMAVIETVTFKRAWIRRNNP
jgi:hypothetical protein